MYIFDLLRQEDVDYAVGNWYVSTHPDSSFSRQLMVARTGNGWRRTLNDGSFAIHRTGCATERHEVADVAELIDLLQREFGIRLPTHAGLRETLTRLIGGA